VNMIKNMQGSDSYRLVVRRGPQPNQVYTLAEDVLNLGRDITNNIVINDREVSRHHLRLMRGDEGYTIEDLGSTNGTFVNGKRVTGATLLKNGDMVGLGETVTLGYERVRGDQGAVSAPPPANSYQAPPPQSPPAQPAVPSSDDAYRPPQSQPAPPQQQPYQPSPQSPPAQPPVQGYPPSSDPYQPDAGDAGYYRQEPAPQDAYAQQQMPPQQQGDSNYYAPQPGYGPPPPGYDYDPYAMREEGGSNSVRLILMGCLGLMLFCCCITVIGVVAVDQLNLYCDLPVVRDVLEALGLLACQV